jgi:hypothetical protein
LQLTDIPHKILLTPKIELRLSIIIPLITIEYRPWSSRFTFHYFLCTVSDVEVVDHQEGGWDDDDEQGNKK